jgi:hypothetical protein
MPIAHYSTTLFLRRLRNRCDNLANMPIVPSLCDYTMHDNRTSLVAMWLPSYHTVHWSTLMTTSTTSNRVTISQSVLAGGAAIAAIMQAQNTAANTEASTIAAKQAAILSAAAFVAKHWKNAAIWYMTGNGSKPEQRFSFYGAFTGIACRRF